MDFRNNIYKDIFQLSPQPMWIYDMETLFFLEVNEAAINDYGYSREDFMKMSIKEIGRKNNIEHIKKNGDVISVELKSNVFKSNGRLTGLVIATDITEQLQRQQTAEKCEEDLLLSESRFKALVQGGSDLTSVIDMEGKYQFLSESCVTLLNIHPEQMIGKTAYNFIHPDDQERVIEKMNMLHDVHRIQIEPFRFLDGNNKWRWLTTTATNMLENPAILGIVTNSTDVTELVNKNNELRVSNERYKLMLKAADEAICDWDIENDIVDWSLGFHEVFGYDLGIYNNTLWSDNIYPEDRDRALKDLNDAVKNPAIEILHSEYRFLKANREIAMIHYRGIFLRDETGKATRAIGSYRDITAHNKNILQVQKQTEQLQEIAWTQSHKIRDSLAKIIGLVALLKEEEFITESQQNILTYLNKSTKDLDDGIREIVNKAQNSNFAQFSM